MKKAVFLTLMIIQLFLVSILPSFAVPTTPTTTYNYWALFECYGTYNFFEFDKKPDVFMYEGKYSIDWNSNQSPYNMKRYTGTTTLTMNQNFQNSSNATSYGSLNLISANYSIGTYIYIEPKSLLLNIPSTIYVSNISELSTKIISVTENGMEKTNPLVLTLINPQGLTIEFSKSWNSSSTLLLPLTSINSLTSFWTIGNYSVGVTCEGLTDYGTFSIEKGVSPYNGTFTDGQGNIHILDNLKQAYFIRPINGTNENGRFPIIVKTNKQAYVLPNGKQTYSIYYYFEGNKPINGTLYSDITMLQGETRFWYSSNTIGLRDFVLYVSENPTASTYSGNIGSNIKTTLSTWQHPDTHEWFVPIQISRIYYGSSPTIDDEINGPVSPWQEQGQTTLESMYTTSGAISIENVTNNILEYMSGFTQFFTVIGSLFSFIPWQIMGLAITGAGLSLALLIFRR